MLCLRVVVSEFLRLTVAFDFPLENYHCRKSIMYVCSNRISLLNADQLTQMSS
jgi:hypothetical protein